MKVSMTSANFQDWNQVILRKNPQKKNVITETQLRPKNMSLPKVKDSQDGEIAVESKVSPELKKRVIQVRVAQPKPNNTQQCFANSLNIPCDLINKLENGTLSHKEAKQIALKIERRYKVKILENL